MFNSVIREKLVQILEKHSLKIKKNVILKFASVKDQIQRSENAKDAGLHFQSSRSNLQSH